MSPQAIIIGREAERRALHDALAGAEARREAVVVAVSGEPGIGKTTLLESLADDGVAARLLLVSGRAAEYERSLPFAIIQDALEPHLDAVPQRALEGLAPEIGSVLPGFADGRVGAVPESERFRVYAAFRELMERLAAGRTVALVLDDLQWVDPASAELIASLLRRPPQASVLLAVAHRVGQLPDLIGRELGPVERAGRFVRIDLGPLSESEARELVGSSALEGLYHESGGNPFFLTQLARGGTTLAVAGGVERGADEALAGLVPPAVATALAAELGGLTPLAQAVAQAGAVAGEPFDPSLIGSIAGVDDADVFDALDELIGVDLVRVSSGYEQFRFRHPLVRRGVYGSIVGGWRIAAHRRADAALAARGATAMTRAHHIERGATMGDLTAAGLLVQAAGQASSGSPALTIRWLQRALALLPEDGPGSEQRPGLEARVARRLAAADRLEESFASFDRAVALDPANATLAAECARVENLTGRHAGSLARLTAALALARDQADTRAIALLEIELSFVHRHRQEFDAMVAAGERAEASASLVGDRLLHGAAAAQLAVGLTMAGRVTAVGDPLEVVALTLAELDDASLGERPDLPYNAAWASFFTGRYAEADALFARAIAACRAADRAEHFVDLHAGLALVKCWTGDVPGAVAASEDALEAALVSASSLWRALALIARCASLLLAGDASGAIAAGDEAMAIAETTGNAITRPASAWMLAGALVEDAQERRAINLVLEAMGGPGLPAYIPSLRPAVYSLLVRGALGDGALEEAEDWALRATAAAAALDLPVAVSLARRAHADVALARGDSDADRSAADAAAAAEVLDAAGARIEATRARLTAGRARTLAGDRERAGVVLRQAEAEAERYGAVLLRAEVVRELRRIGRRVKAAGRVQPAAGGLGALTAREREIGDLVVARRTNREIAALLYLSEKTIETHMSNIFVKLAVRSRADVARRLETGDA